MEKQEQPWLRREVFAQRRRRVSMIAVLAVVLGAFICTLSVPRHVTIEMMAPQRTALPSQVCTTQAAAEPVAEPVPNTVETRSHVPMASCASQFLGDSIHWQADEHSQEDWHGVATSRRKFGVIAVWNSTEVYASRDDGLVFQKLKSSTQGVSDVSDVVVGASGTIFVLRDETISMHFGAKGVREIPVPLSPDAEARLAVGAGYLAIVSMSGMAFSRDYGMTWRMKRVPRGLPDVVNLDILPSGVLHATVTYYNCHSGDYSEEYQGSMLGKWTQLDDDFDLHGHESRYNRSLDGETLQIHEIDKHGRRGVLGEVSADWPATVVHNGRQDYGQFGTGLYRLRDGNAELLDEEVPAGVDVLAADSCNRVLGLLDARLVRWSPSTGWRWLRVFSG